MLNLSMIKLEGDEISRFIEVNNLFSPIAKENYNCCFCSCKLNESNVSSAFINNDLKIACTKVECIELYNRFTILYDKREIADFKLNHLLSNIA